MADGLAGLAGGPAANRAAEGTRNGFDLASRPRMEGKNVMEIRSSQGGAKSVSAQVRNNNNNRGIIMSPRITAFLFLPVDCYWGSWSNFSPCSAWCGTGTMWRTKSKIGPYHGGRHCWGDSTEHRMCYNRGCPRSTASFTRVYFQLLFSAIFLSVILAFVQH